MCQDEVMDNENKVFANGQPYPQGTEPLFQAWLGESTGSVRQAKKWELFSLLRPLLEEVWDHGYEARNHNDTTLDDPNPTIWVNPHVRDNLEDLNTPAL